MPSTSGCYVHIPFCVKKCAYCDFNSYSGAGDALVRRYIEAIIAEIDHSETANSGEVVDTIFFGGGTPTAIPAMDEVAILEAVARRLEVGNDAEITTEANPGTADIEGLEVLRAGGFNRISFGVQSFDSELLIAIDRIHSANEAKKAVHAARRAGFENISIDLMFGLPRQTMTQWQSTVEQALELGTDHLSMYGLIVEDGTGFGIMARKGKLVLPEDDLVADMYQFAIERANAAGYMQYEISNFAKPGKECHHNLHYWRGDDYFGFGAGAVSVSSGVRRTNHLAPGRYADAVLNCKPLECDSEVLTIENQRAEAMMLGLRLTEEGVDLSRFVERFGATPQIFWPGKIERFTMLGLIEPDQLKRLKLTPRGVFLANEVMAEFV